ncbi:MAG: hypothetical protein IKP28_00295 [Clostridia bacterium]|nr:hypothetical protein [Clostridia bacterium]
MENASKALIMAGGVLVAIMILSLGVYLFQAIGNFSQAYDERLKLEMTTSFNSKFEIYIRDINAHEMVTLINLAAQINEQDATKNIEIYIGNNNAVLSLNGVDRANAQAYHDEQIAIMEKEKTNINNTERTYKFVSIEYDQNGYVNILKYRE